MSRGARNSAGPIFDDRLSDGRRVPLAIYVLTSECEGTGMQRKREVIEPTPGDKRYARRSKEGQFTADQTDVGRSLAADRKNHAKKVVPKGQGDRGDQKRAG